MPGLPPLPPPPPGVMAQLMNNNNSAPPPTRLPPRPAFVPHQLRHRVPQQSVPFPSSSMRTPQMPPSIPQRIPSPPPQSQSSIPPQQQSTLSAQPLLYKNQTTNEKPAQPSESSIPTSQRPLPTTPVIENKPAVPKLDKPLVTKLEPNPHPVSKAFASSSQPMETNDHEIETTHKLPSEEKADLIKHIHSHLKDRMEKAEKYLKDNQHLFLQLREAVQEIDTIVEQEQPKTWRFRFSLYRRKYPFSSGDLSKKKINLLHLKGYIDRIHLADYFLLPVQSVLHDKKLIL